ncbi:MAG: threonine-phosphate decarboxylase CobD [Luteibacter sp.]
MLEHGGRLARAAAAHGLPRERWLDLSTGISPHAYPVPSVPASAWHRLPEDDDGLLDVARAYYGAEHLLAVAGSQAAIAALPRLRARARVGVIAPGYAEHAHAWRAQGHDVATGGADELVASADAFDVIVLIHPNNPGGDRFTRETLLSLHGRLAARGGWLVVDEAFIDTRPHESLCADAREGLIVLRSVGKFFGLAGARAGFVFAWPALLETLRETLGPWTLGGPSRHVLKAALADRAWQRDTVARLHRDGTRLADLLTAQGLMPSGGCEFFQYCRHDDAARVHHALATRGILTRYFDDPPALRFGLPGDDAGFQRLASALAEIRR